MKHLKIFEEYFPTPTFNNTEYEIGDILIAKKDYLDIIKQGEEYEIIEKENNLGDDMYYLSYKGRKISVWGFKPFELDIQFDKK